MNADFTDERLRNWLIGVLRENVIEVSFIKKDGTERVMKSTLREDYLPETVGSNKSRSDDALAVFDVDNNGWRSFRWDSIKEIKFTLGD